MTELFAAILLLAAPGLPLALACGLAFARLRGACLALAPWAPLPALGVALTGWPAGPVDLTWLMIGAELGLSATTRILLLFTAGLWLAAGLYAGAYHRQDAKRLRLFAFHLVTMAGNLGLLVAMDAATFYLFFILMSFSAYGLVVHDGTGEARRAGTVYLVLVVIGEVLLLPGLWLAAAHAQTLALPDIAASVGALGWPVVALIATGFAVKAGAVPLHVWLPLAHPVAPTPASAVLSGAMIKAGLAGWLLFLPIGLNGFPGFSGLFIVGGLVAAFYGAAIGVTQARPKTVLAYSSISQMGLIMTGIGIALAGSGAAPAAVLAVTAYALHHALAKGTLFLGVGMVERAAGERQRRAALLTLLLPALALAGAPLTSGVVAKTALKEAAYGLDPGWQGTLDALLPLAAVGTTLLMARFLWLMRRAEAKEAVPGLWTPWLALLAAAAFVSWLPLAVGTDILAAAMGPAAVWAGLWPLALGIALACLAARVITAAPAIPEGDILASFASLGDRLAEARPTGTGQRFAALDPRPGWLVRERRLADGLARAEAVLARWPVVMGLALAAILAMAALTVRVW